MKAIIQVYKIKAGDAYAFKRSCGENKKYK
jgi:hypothetical protein